MQWMPCSFAAQTYLGNRPMRLLEELLAVFPVREVIGDRVQIIERIVLDSRQAAARTLFVARCGKEHDGLTFLRDAYDRGCRVVASDRVPSALPSDCTFILCDDLLGALARWSHALYGNPTAQLAVYGVTGTNGKTTTTALLAHLLSACGEPSGVIGTLGARYGDEHQPTRHTTPEAPELAAMLAWMLSRGATAVAMEVSSHALWWRRVEGTQFAGAIFTNLTQDHLDFHRTMENYARAKKRLFDMLPAGVPAVIFADNEWSQFMVADTQATVLRVGRGYEADVRIVAEQRSASGTQWRLEWDDGRRVEISTPLVGGFNVENASLALVLLAARGYSLERLAEALRTAQAPPGRMEQIALPTGAHAVVDYAHTPDALERVLQQCRAMMEPTARLFCIFGCGGERDRAKRPLMGAIAARYADYAIITNDNPRRENPAQIAADIRAGIELVPAEKRRATFIEELDRRSAIALAVGMASAGDWIVVAGKGHEEYQHVGDERFPFSDRQVLWEQAAATVSNS